MIRTEVKPTSELLDFLLDLQAENAGCLIYVTEEELNTSQGFKVMDMFIADNGTKEVYITIIREGN